MFYLYKNGQTFINVRVTTKASKNEIRGVKNEELLISVTSVPEHNKANTAIIELLGKQFGIAKSKMCIISGKKGRNKKISIDVSDSEIVKILSKIPVLRD